MGRLENKVALVIGASTGMGSETATLFAKEGASVVAFARRKEKLSELIIKIEAGGGKGIAVVGDIINEEDVQNAVKTAIQKYGKIDIVVNNAGIRDYRKPVTELDDDLWNAVINVNLTGPMRVFRATIPEMEKNGGGAFVTIASLGGIKAGIAGSAYTASKFGVLGLAKNIAYIYADKKIRSNIIAPGVVKTPMADKAQNVEENSRRGTERVMTGLNTIPRFGEPKEIAQVALFLASDEASLVNGAVVTADAGWGAY